jgi:hypothetical protein
VGDGSLVIPPPGFSPSRAAEGDTIEDLPDMKCFDWRCHKNINIAMSYRVARKKAKIKRITSSDILATDFRAFFGRFISVGALSYKD